VIEVALILMLIAACGAGSHSLARDTVFAAVMITANEIIGIAMLDTGGGGEEPAGTARVHPTI
jgi:Ca2+/H+ antiporter